MKFGVLLYLALGAANAVAAAAGGSGVKFGRADMVAERQTTHCANMKTLAAGVKKNIKIQHQALSSLAAVRVAVGGDHHAFSSAKAALLANMDAMIRVREANQHIAGAPAVVIQNLQTVASRQAEEKQLVQSLQGVSADTSTISTLDALFNRGIALNTQIAQEAVQGC